MATLKDLKDLIAKDFEEATKHPESKEQIDKFAKYKQIVDDVEKKQQEDETKHQELLKAYGDALIHQSFGDKSKKPNNNIEKEQLNLDDVLNQTIKEYIKKEN